MNLPGGIFRSSQLMAGEHSPSGVRRQLDRWVKSGRIIPLRRGVYMLKNPHGTERAHPFLAANLLAVPSYVSLQSALSYYGMIPEYVPVVTSVTTGRPEEVETPLAKYIFRHVRDNLFFGFGEREISYGQRVLIAVPQKALVDLLYLTSRSDNSNYLRELRLTIPENFSWKELQATAGESGSNKVVEAVRKLSDLHRGGKDERTS